MIQIKICDNIQESRSLILLAATSSDFGQYGLTDEEINYIRKQIEAKATAMAINKGNYWIFVQIADPACAACREKEDMRRGACRIHEWITRQKIREITLVDAVNNAALSCAFAEGLILSNYQFLKYVGKKDEKRHSLTGVDIMSPSVRRQDIDTLNGLLAAVYKARDLVNEPANFMTSVRLSSEFVSMGEEAGFKVEVLNRTDIRKLRMGGLLAVNQGSAEEPTFSVFEWKPANFRNKKPVVLVGKGIVYDSGGYSLKPTTNSMDYMKGDMAGGAAVAAIFYAVAKAGIPLHVIGLVPSTDNRLSAGAYSPGDIITMHDGTTVEVLNTDAEGRLILADALSYARQYEPELVIDLATLTGAAHRAIGEQAMAGMGNAPREIMERLKECGDAVFERIAEFPFWDEYAEDLKSDIADLKNVGGDCAGAITAGKFLEHFTAYPYIHLDIAGPSFLKKADSYRATGGTGVGVRLLFEFLKNY